MVVFEKGSLLFLADESDCYVPARVANTFEQGKAGAVVLLESERPVKISAKHSALAQPMDKQSLRRWDDMVLLKQLDNASLLHNIRLRYHVDEIYTNIGSILISVNPYKVIPNLYSPEMIDKFISCGGNLQDMPPHIFGVAEDSFFQMMEQGEDQSCVITGESGAGKTEATKLYLQYVAERARRSQGLLRPAAPQELAGGGTTAELDVPLREQILGANPIMEAFGNAKTVRNDNSSRFGKLIDVQFVRSQGTVAGGQITNYLLEKSRVVRHLEGERSYHIFYQLCAAATQLDPALQGELKLSSADQYFFLNQSKRPSTIIEHVDDAREWEETTKAMRVLKIAEEERVGVNYVLAGILHLGNVSFEAKGNTDFAQVTKDSQQPLQLAAEMFGLPAKELERALLTRDVSNKSERVIKKHNVREATESRDAMAKHTYSRLFNWLTQCINRALSSRLDEVSPSDIRTISVLDIFGFESFGYNSFEQLCINYCNEKLQGFFNNHIFKLEQEEYMREEIDVSAVGFSDNEGVIATIDDRSEGVFAICDDQVNLLRGSDDGFLAKVLQKAKEQLARAQRAGTLASSRRQDGGSSMRKSITAAMRSRSITGGGPNMDFLTRGNALDEKVFLKAPGVKQTHKNVQARSAFIVVHFAGEVMYNAEGFLEKNRDILRQDLISVVQDTSRALLAKLYSEVEDMPVTDSGRHGRKRHTRKTLGRKFQDQLDQLMLRLGKTEPHFVRTIKPNKLKKTRVFEAPLVLDQLRYAGLLEVCRIRQLGYPARKYHEEFYQTFLCIHPEAKNLDQLLGLLEDDGLLHGREWQKGKTKIFMRAAVFDALSRERETALWHVMVAIQRNIRRFLARTKYMRTKNAFTDLERGTKERDRRLLESTIPFAASLPTAKLARNAALLERARRVLGEIKEQEKTLEALRAAVDAKDTQSLPNLIKVATGMGLGEHELVREAQAIVDRSEQEQRAVAALQAAMASKDLAALQAAIERAGELGLDGSAEARAARALLDRLEQEDRLLAELEEAMAAKSVDRIGDLVQAMFDIGSEDHPTCRRAQKMIKRIIRESEERQQMLDQCNKDLEAAIERRDLDELNALRVRVEELNAKGDVVNRAMALRQQLEDRQRILDKISREMGTLGLKARSLDGIEEEDMEPLAEAIREAADAGLGEDKEPEVRAAVKFLDRMRRQLKVQDQLADALDGSQKYSVLLRALIAAQGLAMETQDARRVAEEVRKLEQIKLEMDMHDAEKLRKEKLALLRYPTPAEKEELERERLDRMDSEDYKALLEDAEGVSRYDISLFYRIREDDDYTEPLRYDEREQAASLKLFSTRQPVPKSVHEVDDLQNVIAKRVNHSILTYCGDIYATSTTGSAQFIVTNGLADPRVADEVYIQLVKHLRGNSSAISEDKCWLLMCMCAKYFPPSDVFAPYLIHFLSSFRQSPGLVGNYARLCLAQLGPTMEIGPCIFKPSLEELAQYAHRPPVLCAIQVIDGRVVTLPVSPEMRLDVVVKLVRQATGIMDAVRKQAWAVFCKDTGEANTDQLRERLVRFYKCYNPSKLPHIDDYVDFWQDREEELFEKLVEQYGKEPEYLADKRDRKPVNEPKSGKERAAQGLMLPITVARAANKLIKGVDRSEGPPPSPKVAWPLPNWVHPGDVYMRMAQQHREPVFIYKRKVLPSKGKADLQLFHQLKMDYLGGTMVVASEHDVAELAVIDLMLRNGNVDLDDKEQLVKMGLAESIPVSWLNEKRYNGVKGWARALSSMVDVPAERDQALRQRYCDILKSTPSYGMALYQVTRADVSQSYVIGVDQYGVHILSSALDLVVKSFPHKAIKKFGAVPGIFWMKIAKSKLQKDAKNMNQRISKRFGGQKPVDIKQSGKGLAKSSTFDFLKRDDGIDVVLSTLQSWELFDNVWNIVEVERERIKKA